MDKINIRSAGVNDIDDIERLNREVQALHIKKYPHIFRETSSVEVKDWIKNQLDADNIHIFLACKEQDIVAYVILKLVMRPVSPFTHAMKIAYIDHICVTQSHRDHGLGRELIKYALKHAQSLGFNQFELNVWSKNINAKKAFEKLGFSTQREYKVLEGNIQ